MKIYHKAKLEQNMNQLWTKHNENCSVCQHITEITKAGRRFDSKECTSANIANKLKQSHTPKTNPLPHNTTQSTPKNNNPY